MKHESHEINGLSIPVYSLNTVIVGSGAAGLNAADSLYSLGQKDIAIVTEGIEKGTSLNAGSDKQTYYKLTLAGKTGDSVREMAETLFAGGSMHGDIALVEAALSAGCFYRLAGIGVPFPHNRYGEYVGYKTDHDPRQRATSAGPLTSKVMTEKIREQIEQKNITIFDNCKIIGILTDKENNEATGLIALNLSGLDNPDTRYVLFNCTNIVYATGGPAGMYGASVYPESQTGANGIAFETGVKGKNLTESQFGIASTAFRWNLSGTYQQVLPRYVSTDRAGGDEIEFLDGYFPDTGTMLDAIFLKGYQWPFDPRKVSGYGSSLIDILVYNETVLKSRRVFLDFTRNPSAAGGKNGLNVSLLGKESRDYLEKSGALFGAPIDRLNHMNRPAVELYQNNGIDIEHERLEIAVCAQHNNGGLVGNHWWESNIARFFPVGEANGAHGVYRPGGSALNSGQVGSARAAQYIAARYVDNPPDAVGFIESNRKIIESKLVFGEKIANDGTGKNMVDSMRTRLGDNMDSCGALIRSRESARDGVKKASEMLENFADRIRLGSSMEIPAAFDLYDSLISQKVYLCAIADYIEEGGQSRGSFIVADPTGKLPVEGLPETFRFSLDDDVMSGKIQIVNYIADKCETEWESAREIPDSDDWFENVWNDFRDGRIIE